MSARAWAIGVAMALLATWTTGWAADEKPSKLEIDVMPYAWVTGIHGTATIGGNTTKIDVTTSDVLTLLFDGNAFASSGYISLDHDRFFLFADATGGYAEVRVDETIPTQLCNLTIRAKSKSKFVIADFGLGYRLGQWTLPNRKRPLTLGVYLGTRYTWFLSELDAAAGVLHGAQRSANVSEDFAWADPLIGIRWSAPLLDWLSLDFRGDIGGFGASSDLVWGVGGSFRAWIPWTPMESLHPYAALGYRAMGSTARPAPATSTCSSGGRSWASASCSDLGIPTRAGRDRVEKRSLAAVRMAGARREQWGRHGIAGAPG